MSNIAVLRWGILIIAWLGYVIHYALYKFLGVDPGLAALVMVIVTFAVMARFIYWRFSGQ